jgi:hypothetical protein
MWRRAMHVIHIAILYVHKISYAFIFCQFCLLLPSVDADNSFRPKIPCYLRLYFKTRFYFYAFMIMRRHIFSCFQHWRLRDAFWVNRSKKAYQKILIKIDKKYVHLLVLYQKIRCRGNDRGYLCFKRQLGLNELMYRNTWDVIRLVISGRIFHEKIVFIAPNTRTVTCWIVFCTSHRYDAFMVKTRPTYCETRPPSLSVFDSGGGVK